MCLNMGVWVPNPNQTSLSPCFISSPCFRFRLKPALPLALMLNMPPTTSKRSICPSCSKPPRTCLCTRFRSPPLDNSVSITILQHSLERNHPLNSTRIAKLGLKNVVIANVSDVLTDATFVIRLMEDNEAEDTGSVEQGVRMCTPHVCENVAQTMESAEAKFSEKDSGSSIDGVNGEMRIDEINLRMDSSRYFDSDSECKIDHVYPDRVEAPTVTVTMGRYGSQCACELQLLPQLSSYKPNFDQLLAVPEVARAFGCGFLVKKFGSMQSSFGSDMQPHTEFELNVPCGSILLFPSDNAVDMKDVESSGMEVKNLIVLDGTWAKATRMYNENPWLKALPHLKLELDKSSLYGEVRTQPKEKCLSTIESIVYALKAIGDSPDGLDGLLDVFESMVGDQRRCMHERLSNLSHV